MPRLIKQAIEPPKLRTETVDKLHGVFQDVADPKKIPLEKRVNDAFGCANECAVQNQGLSPEEIKAKEKSAWAEVAVENWKKFNEQNDSNP